MNRIFCVISRESRIEHIQFLDQEDSVIGRRQTSTIWLPDDFVSREHARIHQSNDRASIRDLGSRNGTLLNCLPLHVEEVINEGDVIQIGTFELKICLTIGDAIRQFHNLEISTRSILNSEPNQPVDKYAYRLPELTPAQHRVLEGFVDGLSEKEVAVRLKVSIHTVHTHAKAIYKAFEISSRPELFKRWAAYHKQEK